MDARHADALIARLRAARSPLFLMHVGADPDCVGSAFALREAFGGAVGMPEGMNKPGERLARHLAFAPDPWPHPENHDAVVAVDLGTSSSLGRLAPRAPSPLLVDHHRYGDLHDQAPARAWDPARASCAEVVLALLDRAGHAPSPEAARALLVGLVTDTARFRHADPAALRAAARLVDLSGWSLQEAYAMLEEDEDETDGLDQRRAMLVAASRAQVVTMGAHLVATSHVGSHDAAAATALVRAGADVAVVAQEKRDLARMSLRGSHRLQAVGLHLGELANEVGREAGWSAGGHEGAAGMRGAPPVAPVRELLLARLRARLGAP